MMWAPMPLNVYTGSASAATNQMSARADRSGHGRRLAVPRRSLVDSRPDRMPPRAPALLRCGGHQHQQGRVLVERANRFSRAIPATC